MAGRHAERIATGDHAALGAQQLGDGFEREAHVAGAADELQALEVIAVVAAAGAASRDPSRRRQEPCLMITLDGLDIDAGRNRKSRNRGEGRSWHGTGSPSTTQFMRLPDREAE